MMASGCQNTTDFEKCLVAIKTYEENGCWIDLGNNEYYEKLQAIRAEKSRDNMHTITVISSMFGRIDHVVSIISSLYNMEDDRKIFLIMDLNIVILLNPGNHKITYSYPGEGPHCGVVTFSSDNGKVKTCGLKWDLDGSEDLKFGKYISTSNLLRVNENVSSNVNNVGEVEIQTEKIVFWMIEFNEDIMFCDHSVYT